VAKGGHDDQVEHGDRREHTLRAAARSAELTRRGDERRHDAARREMGIVSSRVV
jgi:hypothetical protein